MVSDDFHASLSLQLLEGSFQMKSIEIKLNFYFISLRIRVWTLKDIVKLLCRWWAIDMRHFYVSSRSVPIVIWFIDVGCFMSYMCDSPSCLSTICRCNEREIINNVKDMMCCGYAFLRHIQCPDARSLDVCQLQDTNWNDNKMEGRKREWIINNLWILLGFIGRDGGNRASICVQSCFLWHSSQSLEFFFELSSRGRLLTRRSWCEDEMMDNWSKIWLTVHVSKWKNLRILLDIEVFH
jgi:hypothetical protein